MWGRSALGFCGVGAQRVPEIGVVISEVCALQAKVVEEIPAFTFRIKSLSKMYRQKN